MSGSPTHGSAKTGSQRLAHLIRDRRERLGMSRQDLADATGVPYPTIAQIETAYRGVSPSRLGVLARALGLDPAELYNVIASEAPPASGKPARQSRTAPRGHGDWLPNPAYARPLEETAARPTRERATKRAPARVPKAGKPPAEPTAAPEDASPAPAGASADVVEQVVALLSTLPSHERLDALGRVQNRLLSGLVQEEVRRAASRRHPHEGEQL